jgi:hypothetical protein
LREQLTKNAELRVSALREQLTKEPREERDE